MNIKEIINDARENIVALLIGSVIIGALYGAYVLVTLIASPIIIFGIVAAWFIGKYLLNN